MHRRALLCLPPAAQQSCSPGDQSRVNDVVGVGLCLASPTRVPSVSTISRLRGEGTLAGYHLSEIGVESRRHKAQLRHHHAGGTSDRVVHAGGRDLNARATRFLKT